MKFILFLILIGFFITEKGYSQNVKKILTQEELKKLEINDTLYKKINDINFDGGFIGTLLVKKQGKKIKSIEIGTWIRKNSKNGDEVIMNLDSLGRLIDYKEFNKNNTLGFDCKYWYDTINGQYYRLENMTIFDEIGNPIIKGHRYWKTTKDDFGFYKSSKKRKYGKWEYFDSLGNLIEVKEYNEIK